MPFNVLAVLHTYGVDYCCIIVTIIKSEAINLLRKADFSEKKVDHFTMLIDFLTDIKD